MKTRYRSCNFSFGKTGVVKFEQQRGPGCIQKMTDNLET